MALLNALRFTQGAITGALYVYALQGTLRARTRGAALPYACLGVAVCGLIYNLGGACQQQTVSADVLHHDWFGRLHHAHAPARQWAAGRSEWWWHGRVHREQGAAISEPNIRTSAVALGAGSYWRCNGVWFGVHLWVRHGQLHCVSGAAVREACVWLNARQGECEYWIYGRALSAPRHTRVCALMRRAVRRWLAHQRRARERALAAHMPLCVAGCVLEYVAELKLKGQAVQT